MTSGDGVSRSEPVPWLVRAVIEYDGTDFCGFQLQKTGRTVQGAIEAALARVAGGAPRVVGAGRTDAGVHARGQVIHSFVEWPHGSEALRRALNAVLDKDVAVLSLEPASEGFHARYSARSRVYAYTIYNGEIRSPLHVRYSHHVAKNLDCELIGRACQTLVGKHDFLPFGWPPHGTNTVRTVHRAQCQRSGCMVALEIEADAFLRRMVRRIVANLIMVGLKELSVDGFEQLLSLKDRRTPATEAPSNGLCLLRVNY